jgi:hypothetical protein
MTKPLADGYRAEFGALDDEAWSQIVESFQDASIYQLWHCGRVRGRFSGTSRSIVLRCGEVVSATEVRLFTLPLTQRGIAYVRWGPMWRRHGGREDVDVFRQAVRALKSEYVTRRQMILRLNPRLVLEDHADCQQVLSDEGLESVSNPMQKTLLVDLSPGIEELRQRLDKKWRNCLRKAEKSQLSIASGRSGDLFDEFAILYRSMLERKRFAPTADLEGHRRLQEVLPYHLKMEVVIARQNGLACAGAIFSALGDTGTYLFGATNELGMRTSASYLVHWEVLNRLTASGFRTYDLNGINAQVNPGPYHFKKGLAGSNGREVTFASQVQAREASLTNALVLMIERSRHGLVPRFRAQMQ